LALTEYSLWYILAAAEEALSFTAAATAKAEDQGRRPFEPEFEAGRCLWLPQGTPLFLPAGLTLAQIGPPSDPLPAKPEEAHPVWLAPTEAGPEETVLFQDQRLSVRLITTAQRSGLTASEALTFIWPIAGQGRVLTPSPAPTTRLFPGRAVLLPAALGRYAVESAGTVSYLLIESR
jgi:hypothetical protein